MAKDYFSCAEVAKLVRAALKESFPGTKFSVKSHTYSMGATVSVCWMDGPNEAQVESITNLFYGLQSEGVDSTTTRVKYVVDGVPVKFLADQVLVQRVFSEAFIQEAIDNLYSSLKDSFDLHRIEKPTIEAFNLGELWTQRLVWPEGGNETNVQELLRGAMHTLSKVAEVKPSATLARIQRSDDKKQEGSGHA